MSHLLLKTGSTLNSDKVAQGFVQLSLENVWGQILQKLFVQPVPMVNKTCTEHSHTTHSPLQPVGTPIYCVSFLHQALLVLDPSPQWPLVGSGGWLLGSPPPDHLFSSPATPAFPCRASSPFPTTIGDLGLTQMSLPFWTGRIPLGPMDL